VHEELLKIAEAAAPKDLGRFPALQRRLAAAVLEYIQVCGTVWERTSVCVYECAMCVCSLVCSVFFVQQVLRMLFSIAMTGTGCSKQHTCGISPTEQPLHAPSSCNHCCHCRVTCVML
jgi:hypothetical protein